MNNYDIVAYVAASILKGFIVMAVAGGVAVALLGWVFFR